MTFTCTYVHRLKAHPCVLCQVCDELQGVSQKTEENSNYAGASRCGIFHGKGVIYARPCPHSFNIDLEKEKMALTDQFFNPAVHLSWGVFGPFHYFLLLHLKPIITFMEVLPLVSKKKQIIFLMPLPIRNLTIWACWLTFWESTSRALFLKLLIN